MAQRIVSLVPSHTETLHDIGAASRVVGRTRFCIHPKPWVDSVAIVGGTKDAKLERILALRPDLVVADKDENPRALVEALEAAGVPVLWSDIATVPDAADFVARLGEATGARASAQEWRDRILAAATQGAAASSVPVFCPIWHDPWMTFNATSYCNDMLARAGLRNVFAERAGPKYFEVTADDVVAAGPEVTLLPSEPYPFHARRAAVDTSRLGPAGGPGRVLEIDGEALTWFGTRTLSGLGAMADAGQAARAAILRAPGAS